MITLDSNKIEIPGAVLMDFDKQKFEQQIKKVGGKITSDKWVINSKYPGLKRVEINNKKGSALITTSAKILAENYIDGISINTIEQVFDAINSTGLLSVNSNNAIDTAILHSCDVTNNLKVGYSASVCADSLNTVSNSGYKVDRYKTKKNDGIAFTSKVRGYKKRVIGYDKQLDLLRAVNSNFIKGLQHPVKVWQDFEGVFRIEQNLAQHNRIRKTFGISTTGLLSALNSRYTPNYNVLFEVVKGGYQSELFNMKIGKWYLFEKEQGRRAIIEQLNYDIDLVKQLLKKNLGGNVSRYVKEYRELIEQMKGEKLAQISAPPDKVVEKILNTLKAA